MPSSSNLVVETHWQTAVKSLRAKYEFLKVSSDQNVTEHHVEKKKTSKK